MQILFPNFHFMHNVWISLEKLKKEMVFYLKTVVGSDV